MGNVKGKGELLYPYKNYARVDLSSATLKSLDQRLKMYVVASLLTPD